MKSQSLTWLKGLGVAVGSALITSALAVPIAPESFNFSRAGLVHLAMLAAPIALKTTLAYLKQSPIQSVSAPPQPPSTPAAATNTASKYSV